MPSSAPGQSFREFRRIPELRNRASDGSVFVTQRIAEPLDWHRDGSTHPKDGESSSSFGLPSGEQQTETRRTPSHLPAMWLGGRSSQYSSPSLAQAHVPLFLVSGRHHARLQHKHHPPLLSAASGASTSSPSFHPSGSRSV